MLRARFPLSLLLSFLFFGVFAQDSLLTIDFQPMDITQCSDAQITWSGGTPPYDISMYDPSDNASLLSMGTTISPIFTGIVNMAASTSVTIGITDSVGATAFSNVLVVQDSNENECLAQSETDTPSTTTTQPAPSPLTPVSTESPSSIVPSQSTSVQPANSPSYTSLPPSSSPHPPTTAKSTPSSASASTLSAAQNDRSGLAARIVAALLTVLVIAFFAIYFLVRYRRDKKMESAQKDVEKQSVTREQHVDSVTTPSPPSPRVFSFPLPPSVDRKTQDEEREDFLSMSTSSLRSQIAVDSSRLGWI